MVEIAVHLMPWLLVAWKVSNADRMYWDIQAPSFGVAILSGTATP